MRATLPSVLAVVALVAVAHGKPAKGLNEKSARKLIATMPGVELRESAVCVRQISSTETSAEAFAHVTTAFRLRKEGEAWRVVEVRTGDRRWEDVDLIARAFNVRREGSLLEDAEALAAELESLRKQRAGDEAGGKGGSDCKKADEKGAEPREEGVRRGALVAHDVSALLSSGVLETRIDVGVRFAREGGTWRVVSVRLGEGEWREPNAVLAVLNGAKNARAREDLATLAAALREYRRERGFYVVAASEVVLVDHLSPRYLTRIIRIDPWSRPYRYEGGRDRFVLSSDGADGKAGTSDDVVIGG